MIQSTTNDSVYYDSYEQVDTINYSEEQVDARNWLRDNSTEQVDQIIDSDKQVDAMSYSEKLVDAGRDPKSDPSRNPKVVTHTNNGNFKQKLFINQTIPVVVVPIWPDWEIRPDC